MTLGEALSMIRKHKRIILITLAIILGVLAWLDYWRFFFDYLTAGPIIGSFNALAHYFWRSGFFIIYNGIPIEIIPKQLGYIIQEYIQSSAPVLLFLIASFGDGIPDGLLNTGIVASLFIVGRNWQISLQIYDYLYLFSQGFGLFFIPSAVAYGIVITMVLLGFIGSFFAQFQVYSVMWKSFTYSFHKFRVLLTWLFLLIVPFVIGFIFNVNFITYTQLQFGIRTISYIDLLVICFVYAFVFGAIPAFFSKRFWSGAIIGTTISLAAFIGILRTGALQLLHDLVWLPYYIATRGSTIEFYYIGGVWHADLNLAYTALVATFIVISALWGGFWASMGKVNKYTEPPSEMITPQGQAFIFRDLWSNYFLFGKNKVDEFKKKRKIKSEIKKIFRQESEYETYEQMDRVPRDEHPTLPEYELEIISQEENKARVRVRKSGEEIGPVYDPNYLKNKYKPVWNPFELVHRANIVRAIMPIMGLIIAIASLYVIINTGGYLQYVFLPDPLWRFFTTDNVRIIFVATIVLLGFIIIFSIIWGIRSYRILNVSPEGAPSVILIGIFTCIAFIFSEYILNQLAYFININILNSLFFRIMVLGETFKPGLLWIGFLLGNPSIALGPSLLDQYVLLSAINLTRIFPTILHGILLLLIAALLLGLGGIQVLGLERYTLYFYAKEGSLFPYKRLEDAPVWVEGKYYWVMRFTFSWPGEFTLALRSLYHEDYERVEVWVNAETGVLEWIVSDYHWRELFYRVPDDGKDHRIIVDFNFNFHTPGIRLLHPEDLADFEAEDPLTAASKLSKDWIKRGRERTRELSSAVFDTVSSGVGRDVRYEVRTRSKYVNEYLIGIPRLFKGGAVNFAAKLPWSFWRYPLGVSSIDPETGKYYYREKNYLPPPIGAPLYSIKKNVDGIGTPAVLTDHVCSNCLTLNTVDLHSNTAKNWECKNCGEDMRRKSLIH